MKKAILTITCTCLLIAMPTFAQTLNDYVDEVIGDTLVVKEFWDMGTEGEPSTLINAIELDTEAPAGRVYRLKTGGWYPLSRALNTPTDRIVRIVGDNDTPMAMSDATTYPPLVTGYTDGTNTQSGDIIVFKNDVVVKNIMLLPAVDDGSFGWTCMTAGAPDNTFTMDNVLMEHTKWVMIQSNDYAGTSVHLNNCYFVNMSGQACRRNGGVYDNVSNNTDTMYVENCTHVMAQGMMYKFRNYPLTKAFFNHNTFVNCAGQLFETFGYQNNWVVTNNLFVNSHVQGYMPGLDYGETDQDSLPMGIINVDAFPSSTGYFEGLTEAGRKILVNANGVYWDLALDAIVPALNDGAVNGSTDWVSQMITMNTRTQDMFDDDATYPLLTEGAWIEGGDPAFVTPADLMTDALDGLITFSISTADESSTDVLPTWRVTSTPVLPDNFIYPDWPIAVDLSYTNSAYLTAGYGGLPLGDLNWFPTQKAAWEAQKDVEHATIEIALNSGDVGVDLVTNRVTNGSFEKTAVGPVELDGIVGWALEVGSGVDPAPDFEIVDDPVQQGSHALAITVNSLGTNAWDIQAIAEGIPVTPGATYSYSIWAKTSDPGGSKASFTVGNAAYQEYLRIHEAALSTEWQEFTKEFTITDDYTTVRAPIHFSIAGNVGDKIYVDNLKITLPEVSVEQIQALPTEYVLSQNYPNPFNPTTTIEFTLSKRSEVSLVVYDILGRIVTELASGNLNAGCHTVNFNASNLASGVYFYKLTAGDFVKVKKLMLLK